MKKGIFNILNKIPSTRLKHNEDPDQSSAASHKNFYSDEFDFKPQIDTTHYIDNFEIIERKDTGESISYDDSRTKLIIPNDEKHYNKLGFYCAFEPVDNPNEKFNELVSNLQQQTEAQIKQISEVYEQTIYHIDYKINLRESNLGEEKESLRKHREQIGTLKAEREKLQKELADFKKALHVAYQELANQKKDLMDKKPNERLKEIDDELKTIIEKHKLFAEEKYQISKRTFADSEPVLKQKIERFTALRAEKEAAYVSIKKKIEELSRSGLTFTAIKFLSSAGLMGVVAAGWFYSVFILATNIQSENYFSFFLNRIIKFGDSKFSAGQNLLVTGGIFLGVLLFLLALTCFIFWTVQILVRKRESDINKSELMINIKESEKFIYQTQISSSSIFNLWMQIVPYIFILGTIFILISLFGSKIENSSDLDKLLKSLSGQFIGVVIALTATGVIILYISMIIEPRMVNQLGAQKKGSPLLKHCELTLSIIMFFILMIYMLMPGNNFTKREQNPAVLEQQIVETDSRIPNIDSSNITSTIQDSVKSNKSGKERIELTPTDSKIAIVSFIVIILFTALTLGYGTKYHGLFKQARRLELQIKGLSIAIEEHSKSPVFEADTIMNEKFKEEFSDRINDFMEMIKQKNRLALDLLNDNIETQSEKQKNIFGLPRKKEDSVSELYKMTPIEEKLFPGIKQTVDDLNYEWKSKEAEFEKVTLKIEQIENRQSELEHTILQRIHGLESALIKYRKQKIMHRKDWHQSQNALRYNFEKKLAALKDGYDLGLTFKNSNPGVSYKLLPAKADTDKTVS